jgi:hypothetical protein
MIMTEAKPFPTPVVLSLTTGLMLSKFDAIHEAAEWVAGHPIWTHEFGMKNILEFLRETVYEQHPQLKSIKDDHINADNYKEFIQQVEQEVGLTIVLQKGHKERHKSPLETLVQMINKSKEGD